MHVSSSAVTIYYYLYMLASMHSCSFFCCICIMPSGGELSGIQLQNRTPSSVQDSSKSQQGNIQMAGQASQQQGNRLLQNGRQNMFQSSQPKNIPTYLDEFKHGFPTNGLSSVSTKWWGTSGLDGNEMLEEEHLADEAEKLPFGESVEDMEASKVKTERETEKGDTGAALLLSLRKRASVEGREAVKLGVARGYGAYKLRRKERAMLFQIFRSSYPSEWE
eukprot:TRINITY_DN5034_c0_g1_i2.p1 TRINITY_DN5034_c0_g1~~TRINITY_DN5034_c0_g1_i2.p1  ORF type:complete len:220 (-),score=55.40 TRINITY_DN5034_c0_g1_i2:330-989(-)